MTAIIVAISLAGIVSLALCVDAYIERAFEINDEDLK